MDTYKKAKLKERFKYTESLELTIVSENGEVTNEVVNSFDEAVSEIEFYEIENEVYF